MTSASQNSVTLAAEETAFRQIILDHLFRYLGLQIQDCYKLIHQAAMASEHADQDIAGARDWLERELNSLGEGPDAEGQLPFAPTELGGFFSKMEADRFPTVHHSEAYKATYHPAYRVIVCEFLVW